MKKQLKKQWKNLLLAGALFCIGTHHVKANFKLWDKVYGGDHYETPYAAAELSDGFIVVGESVSAPSGNKTTPTYGGGDFWILKCSNNGAIQWQQTYGGIHTLESCTSVLPTQDGGYLVGGYSSSPISGNKGVGTYGKTDYWVLKLDANGNKLWEKNYGGADHDYLVEIQPTSDGNYILGGYSFSGQGWDKSEPSRGKEDAWIIKIDEFGNKIWDKSIGGNRSDILNSLKLSADGKDFILGLASQSGVSGDKSQAGFGKGDVWIVYLRDLGGSAAISWDRTFGSQEKEDNVLAKQTVDGSYVIACSSEGGMSGNKTEMNRGQVGESDYWMIKLDSAFNIQWQKTLGGSDKDEFADFEILPNGRYLLGGTSHSQASGEKTESLKGSAFSDYWLVEVNPSNGFKTWDKSIGGIGMDTLMSMTYLPNEGSCLLVGDAYTGPIVLGEVEPSSDWPEGYDTVQAGAGFNRSEDGFGFLDYWIVKIARGAVSIVDSVLNKALDRYILWLPPCDITPGGPGVGSWETHISEGYDLSISALAKDQKTALPIAGVAQQPSHGRVRLINSELIYTPHQDYLGTDHIVFQALSERGIKQDYDLTIEVKKNHFER